MFDLSKTAVRIAIVSFAVVILLCGKSKAECNNPDVSYQFGRDTLHITKPLSPEENAALLKKEIALAEKGYISAQMHIGEYYLKGCNDSLAAMTWFFLAAEQGHSPAQNFLRRYGIKPGSPQYYKEALKRHKIYQTYLEKPSEETKCCYFDDIYPEESYNAALGEAYYTGAIQGIPQDYIMAFNFLSREAASNLSPPVDYYPGTATWLGELYYNGKGGIQDFKKAKRWLSFAASGEEAGGRRRVSKNLILMPFFGRGAPANYTEAYKYYLLWGGVDSEFPRGLEEGQNRVEIESEVRNNLMNFIDKNTEIYDDISKTSVTGAMIRRNLTKEQISTTEDEVARDISQWQQSEPICWH